MFNLNATADLVLHPEIPYFDDEHLFVGGVTALITSVVLGLILVYTKRLEKNIYERKQIEEMLKETENKYRSLVDSTDDSIYLVDRNYKYLFINKKHLSRMGLSDVQYNGRSFGEFHSQFESKLFSEKVDMVFETGESAQYEYKSFMDSKYFLQTCSPVKDKEGKTVAVTIISKEITKLKNMENELIQLSYTDAHTGLYNRRGFFNLMEHQLKLAKRQKKKLFLLYADLDNFKNINDQYGHQEGDLALVEVARILKNTYRESDIIARIGGDEFVVFPIETSEDHADTIYARLQKNFETYNLKNSRDYKLSMSVGISSFDPESPATVDDLLDKADKLMYEHKRRKSCLT
jgi:diguanylate cyclase (GGDEF)-like protein/PAS domain S-box-containing protein